ncbi:MAG: hypothetical protein IJK52_13040 [Oscillospiraceae bacterium]|nr:hypothetical protein [Oscillospiraceae bacterium]
MKKLTLCAVLTALLCVTAACAADVQISRPLVSGHGIWADDLSGLEEIAVPVQSFLDAPTQTNLFASFYDGNGKFVGAGLTAAAIDSETSFVIMPVQSDVTGAETLKMLATDDDFRPLSNPASYSLTGGGGGGGGGSYSPNRTTYYLRATADTAYENGGYGMAYLTETEPTEDTDLSQLSQYSAIFQHESSAASYGFTYYVIFAPDAGSALEYPRIVQGLNAESVAKVNVTLKSAPSATVYRIFAWSGASSVNNSPLVTLKGVIRGDGSGGGGNSGGGGGGGSSSPVSYPLTATAAVDGGNGAVYLTPTLPATLPATPVNSLMLTQTSPNFTFYAIFTPDDGYELADTPTVSGNATIEKVDAALESSPASVVYRVSATGVQPVTVTGTFRPVSGGGGIVTNRNNETPIL